MTIPEPVSGLYEAVRARLGAIMRNPLRIPNLTCATCTAPIAPQYTLCFRCHMDALGGMTLDASGRSALPIARRVVPLAYAVFGQQSNIDMHRYKDALPEQQRLNSPSFQRVLLLVLGFALMHAGCLDRVSNLPVTRLAFVPSLSGRPGPHPLTTVGAVLPHQWQRVALEPVPGVPEEERRKVSLDHFVLPAPTDVVGQHVAILEDTWVQGGHVQSAAATILRAGAADVTVVVIARRLKPDNRHPPDFWQMLGPREYTLQICPVTGGACPN